MTIHVMSVSGSNRFSPVHLQSVLNDITHYGLLLEGYASIIVLQPALKGSCANRLAAENGPQVFRETQKQAQFYKQQLSPQLAYVLTESKKAAQEQIKKSTQIINCQQPDSEARKTVAGLVEGINTTFVRHYASSRNLYEEVEWLSDKAEASYQQLASELDVYTQELTTGQAYAMAVMAALDLQEETIQQHLDGWVTDTLSGVQEKGQVTVQRSTDSHNGHYDYLALSECSENALAIDRNNQQKLALHKELDRIDPTLAGLKREVLLLKAYSQYISKLAHATKRLVTNWGKISNNLAMQAHELSSQSDCNQLFKVITTDVPSAKKSWRFLAKRIDVYERRLANKNPYCPAVH